MKEKDAQFKTDRKLVMYVEKDNGAFRPIETGSYMVETHFDDFLEKRDNLKRNLSTKLINNEISPIEYYRVLINISVGDLASRIGISSRKVKKHLLPVNFKSIKLSLLKRYADIFRIPVANFFQLTGQAESNLKIKHTDTDNPFIILTSIKEDKNVKN